MALDLTIPQVLLVSLVLTVSLLLVAFGIAGYYERRARRRREARMQRRSSS